MRTVIAGSRKCGLINNNTWDYEFLINIIDQVVRENNLKITEVISGHANGPDKAGEMWAKRTEIPVRVLKPDWNKGRMAAFITNNEMAKIGDILIVIWDGKSTGTQHMINQMQKLGKQIYYGKNTH